MNYLLQHRSTLFIIFVLLALIVLMVPYSAEAALVRTQRIFTDSLVANFSSPGYTTSTFTPSNNSLLVVAIVVLDCPGGISEDNVVVSGGSLTWTRRASISDGACYYGTQIWTAPVSTGAPMAVTVTVTGGSDGEINIDVENYTGYNKLSPIDGTATGSQGSNALTLTLSRNPAKTSHVFGLGRADCADSISPGGSGGFTEINHFFSDCGTTNSSFQTQSRTNSNSTVVDWTKGSGGDSTMWGAAVEIKAAPTVAKPPNNLGLVGYWSFNEGTSTKATDFSGNGNHGTLTNNPTWVNGKRDKALSFVDGTADYVNALSPSALDNIELNGGFTVAFWTKPTQYGEFGNGKLVSKVSGSGDPTTADGGWIISYSNFGGIGRIYFRKSFDSTVLDVETNQGTPLNAWTYIVVTWDGSSSASGVHIYLNGSEATYRVQTDGVGNKLSDEALNLLFPFSQENLQMNGLMDEVRVYSRALGASEVTKLYAGGTSGAARANASSVTLQNGTTLGPANGLVGHWTFDGGDTNWTSDTAGTTYDRSGNGNNGTFTNMNRKTSVDGGKLGQAFSFNGSGQYMTTPLALSSDQAVSIAGWLYSAESAATYRNFFDTQSSRPMIWWNTSGQIEFDTSGSFTTSTAYRNVWVHVALVKPAGTSVATYYVDSVAVGTGESYAVPALTPTWFNRSGAQTWFGKADDIRVYNRTLTAAEVKQLYNLGQTKLRP